MYHPAPDREEEIRLCKCGRVNPKRAIRVTGRGTTEPPQAFHEPMCARCGSSAMWEPCDSCEDGMRGHECGEDTCCCLYPDDNLTCDICNGDQGWYVCLSSPEWCLANPRPGYENVDRGTIA